MSSSGSSSGSGGGPTLNWFGSPNNMSAQRLGAPSTGIQPTWDRNNPIYSWPYDTVREPSAVFAFGNTGWGPYSSCGDPGAMSRFAVSPKAVLAYNTKTGEAFGFQGDPMMYYAGQAQWTPIQSFLDSKILSLVYSDATGDHSPLGQGVFLAVDSNGNLWQSSDQTGQTFYQNYNVGPGLVSVTARDGIIVVASPYGMWYTGDLNNWKTLTISRNYNFTILDVA